MSQPTMEFKRKKNKSNAEAWHNPLGPSITENVQQIISVTLSHALHHKCPNDPRVKDAWIKAIKLVHWIM